MSRRIGIRLGPALAIITLDTAVVVWLMLMVTAGTGVSIGCALTLVSTAYAGVLLVNRQEVTLRADAIDSRDDSPSNVRG